MGNTLKIRVRPADEYLLMLTFWAFVLQDPLSVLCPIFAYTDEMIGLFGLVFLLIKVIRTGKLTLRKSDLMITFSLLLFVAAGLLGNIFNTQQRAEAIFEDLYINLKFFLAIMAGCTLFSPSERKREVLLSSAKTAVFLLFCLLLADLFFHIFPSTEKRYGLRVVQLFYKHPTYLAGVSVFLLSVLTIYNKKENSIFICLCLCLLFFTLRGKAIAAVFLYPLIFYFCVKTKKGLRFSHIVLMVGIALTIAWDRFSYYYLELSGISARSALTLTSFEILKDHFPIGTGFGTFASHTATEFYSPVYLQYGLDMVHGLGEMNSSFGSDTFWPIIIGQCGFIGLLCYLFALMVIFRRLFRIGKTDRYAYAAGVFLFSYLMISSTSEPTFCNAMSIPLAFLIGLIYSAEETT